MKRQLAIAILLLLATTAITPAVKPTQIIVNGEGSVTMLPDQATVSASVVTNAPSAADAVSQNNRTYDRVAAAIERAGVAKEDITLSYYNVDYLPRPTPTPPNPSPYARYGYTVTRSFSVMVRSIGKAGAVVDAATSAGATNIGGVGFGLADPSRAKGQATAKAVADARVKAESVARAAGLQITGIARIQLDGGGIVAQPVLRVASMAAPSEPTTFNPGNVNVRSNVTIVFLAVP